MIPFFEAFEFLDLSIMTISTAGDEVYTTDGVPIKLDWVTQIQLSNQVNDLRTAARAFLGKSVEEIQHIIKETLSANFRAIVGQMPVEDVHRDRDKFVQKVQELAADEMELMGMNIISTGVKEIKDDLGYFDAMSTERVEGVKSEAKIAKAEADRRSRIRAAEANREATQSELSAQKKIVQQAEDLAIREVEKEKKVKLAQAKANAEAAEEESIATEKQLRATQIVPAEKNRKAAQINSEAEKIELTVAAAAAAEEEQTKAQGDAAATKLRAEADAEAIQKKGLAEAETNKAKLLSEAEGQRKLAEAIAAEGEVNLRQYAIDMLAQVEVSKAEAIANALGNIGSNVRITDFGGGSGTQEGNALTNLLMGLTPVITKMDQQVRDLSGDGDTGLLERIEEILETIKKATSSHIQADLREAPVEEEPGE